MRALSETQGGVRAVQRSVLTVMRGLRTMASTIPSTMRALALAAYGKPSEYDIATLPTPQITKDDEVLIKVHAASINPVDVKVASGMTKIMKKDSFPYKIGYDASGTVAAIGKGVTTLKVGDAVYSRVPSDCKGSVAEYVLSYEYAVAAKPTGLSFSEAASIPLVGLTALQAMQRADEQLLPGGGGGGLKGKTVYVPAGLSGTGSAAVQLARNVFGAARVFTTVSTGKIAKAKEIFGDGDGSSGELRLVDYTKEDVVAAIGSHQVDYMFDTMGQTLKVLPIMKPGGVIVSIGTVPSGDLMAKGTPEIPWIFRVLLNLADWYYRWQSGRSSVNYSYIFMTPDAKGLNDYSKWIQEGKFKPVVGRTAKFSDIDAVRKGCQEVFDGKGGIGKFVIEID